MISDVVDTWITRSEGRPLNYSVLCNLYEVSDTKYHSDVERIITALLSQQHRWGVMVISCYNVQFSSPFLRSGMILTNMPMLESLSLTFGAVEHTQRVINISRSPQLRHLELDGDFTLKPIENSLCSFHRFKFVFRESDPGRYADMCLDILRYAPNIHTLVADFSEAGTNMVEPEPEEASKDIVVASNLQDLEVKTYRFPSKLFGAWKLPALKRLYLTCFSGSNALADFFRHSLPPLTFLTICHMWPFAGLAEILRLLPTLQALQLISMDLDLPVLRGLTVTEGTISFPDAGVMCPELDILHFSSCRVRENADVCLEALITMLKSRATTTLSFRTICFKKGPDALGPCDVNSIHKGLLDPKGICVEVGDVYQCNWIIC